MKTSRPTPDVSSYDIPVRLGDTIGSRMPDAWHSQGHLTFFGWMAQDNRIIDADTPIYNNYFLEAQWGERDTLMLSPQEFSIDNNNLTKTIEVSGTAEGPIGINPSSYFDVITVEVVGENIIVTGTRPAAGEPAVSRQLHASITRGNAFSESIWIDVDLTPLPSGDYDINISQNYTSVGSMHQRTVTINPDNFDANMPQGMRIEDLYTFIMTETAVGDVVLSQISIHRGAPSISFYHSPNVTRILVVIADGMHHALVGPPPILGVNLYAITTLNITP